MKNKLTLEQLCEEFIASCFYHDLEPIKNLYQQLLAIKNDNEDAFKEALIDGIYNAGENRHWHIVQYLLKENIQDLYPDGCLNANQLLYSACLYNEFEVAKTILEADKIKSLNLDLEPSFEKILFHNYSELINAFIFDYNIPRTESLNDYFKIFNGPIVKDIVAMFEARELNKSLKEELQMNETTSTKKVKI
jgi:hypothetical protein